MPHQNRNWLWTQSITHRICSGSWGHGSYPMNNQPRETKNEATLRIRSAIQKSSSLFRLIKKWQMSSWPVLNVLHFSWRANTVVKSEMMIVWTLQITTMLLKFRMECKYRCSYIQRGKMYYFNLLLMRTSWSNLKMSIDFKMPKQPKFSKIGSLFKVIIHKRHVVFVLLEKNLKKKFKKGSWLQKLQKSRREVKYIKKKPNKHTNKLRIQVCLWMQKEQKKKKNPKNKHNWTRFSFFFFPRKILWEKCCLRLISISFVLDEQSILSSFKHTSFRTFSLLLIHTNTQSLTFTHTHTNSCLHMQCGFSMRFCHIKSAPSSSCSLPGWGTCGERRPSLATR